MKRRSAILMPNWIGDLLMALSVVERLPGERRRTTTLLVPKPMCGLVGLLSDFPQLAYERSDRAARRRTVDAVRAGGFRSIYLLPYSFSSAWFAMKTRIPVRRGLDRELRGVLLTERLPSRLRDKSRHITREYAEILGTSFHAPEEWQGVRLDPDSLRTGSVVYCPGAAYGPAKRWRHFPDLALLQAHERIIVLGTAADSEAAEAVARAAPERVENLAGKTSLPEAAAIMAGAKAVVSNDSGLMHLAAYLGTPVVGLFGSTSPVWTRPLGMRSMVLTGSEPCAPCFERTCRYGHYRCLENISAERVAEAVGRLL